MRCELTTMLDEETHSETLSSSDVSLDPTFPFTIWKNNRNLDSEQLSEES